MSARLLEVLTLESVGVGPDVSSVVRGLYIESVGVGPDVSLVVRGPYARVGRRWSRCQLGC